MKNTPKTIARQGDDEKMNRKTTIFLRGVFAALMLSAVFASSASAAPAWNFQAKALEGKETIVGAAIESSLTVPGLTTKCANFLYKLVIKNEAGTGKGEVTELPLYECSTSSKFCTVEAIAAQELPWTGGYLTKIESTNYIVIEKVKVNIWYAGELCALGGSLAVVKGNAGGRVDNATETATFDSSSFKATKTELKALGGSVIWTGVFPTEAFEWHREQALTVS
jgi:hypothetical protein